MSECKICGSTNLLTFGQFLKALQLEDISECGRPAFRTASEEIKLYRAYRQAAFAQAEKDQTTTADEIEQIKMDRDGCKSANSLLHADIRLLRQQLAQALADVARLRVALTTTRENMESWAGYADEYFLEKHDLAGDIALANGALSKTSSDAFIKRKQAEALDRVADNAVKPMTQADLRKVANLYREEAVSARRLRGEVDDAAANMNPPAEDE